MPVLNNAVSGRVRCRRLDTESSVPLTLTLSRRERGLTDVILSATPT
jgi:hypothetical protein